MNNVKQRRDGGGWVQGLTHIASVVVTAVSSFVVVLAGLHLKVGQIELWSIIGVDVGVTLAFLGLNLDTYSASRRDVIPVALVNIAVLTPSTLTGFSTHQWSRALKMIGLACVGCVGGWGLSRWIVRQSGSEEKDQLLPLAIVRLALSGMLVILTMLAYILLPMLEIEMTF